jgi:hypothetical protein
MVTSAVAVIADASLTGGSFLLGLSTMERVG